MKEQLYLKSFIIILSVIASGVLLAFSMPPYNFWWLAYIALVPVIVIASKQKPLISFGTGMVTAGITGFVLGGYPSDIQYAANLFAGFGSLALITGIVLFLISYVRDVSTPVWILFTASAGVFAEWIATHLLPASISISQHTNPYALKLASLVGIWGVTFVIWYVSACIAAIFMGRKQVIKPAITMLCMIILLIAYTYITPYVANESGILLRVAAIQGSDSYTLSDETAKLAGKTDIAVWPETGLSPDDPDVYKCARKNNVYIAANFLELHGTRNNINISYYISPDGEVLGKSRKRHLFGKEIFSYSKTNKSSRVISDTTGRRTGLPTSFETLKIGLPTCYDTMFTDVVRNNVRDGARLILVPNSDPEAPNHLFARMHLGMTAFRAAENMVQIVIADPRSISAIIDSRGNIIKTANPGEPGYIADDISPEIGRTIYNRIGDIFAYLCILFVLSVFISIIYKHISRLSGILKSPTLADPS